MANQYPGIAKPNAVQQIDGHNTQDTKGLHSAAIGAKQRQHMPETMQLKP